MGWIYSPHAAMGDNPRILFARTLTRKNTAQINYSTTLHWPVGDVLQVGCLQWMGYSSIVCKVGNLIGAACWTSLTLWFRSWSWHFTYFLFSTGTVAPGTYTSPPVRTFFAFDPGFLRTLECFLKSEMRTCWNVAIIWIIHEFPTRLLTIQVGRHNPWTPAKTHSNGWIFSC